MYVVPEEVRESHDKLEEKIVELYVKIEELRSELAAGGTMPEVVEPGKARVRSGDRDMISTDYILIRSNEPMIKLPDLDKPVNIIWLNTGNCGIISVEKVENMMELAKDVEQNNDLRNPLRLVFFWDDAEEVRENYD